MVVLANYVCKMKRTKARWIGSMEGRNKDGGTTRTLLGFGSLNLNELKDRKLILLGFHTSPRGRVHTRVLWSNP
jgi:hypothetical protein